MRISDWSSDVCSSDLHVAAAVLGSVISLPETVQLMSMRTLGWPMARLLNAGARLNLLSLEALAAARHLPAEICLDEHEEHDLLRAAARDFEVSVRSVGACRAQRRRGSPPALAGVVGGDVTEAQ